MSARSESYGDAVRHSENPEGSFVHSLRNISRFLMSGRMPSRRAWAALAKFQGRRLERHWPYLPRATPATLNLGFEDVLEFQYARSRAFRVLVVGAYDGVENDPTGQFVLSHETSGILIEPQPQVFAKLRSNFGNVPRLHLVNAAIDLSTGTRELFHVPNSIAGLPSWVEQLASFDREHIEKHEDRAPGISRHIARVQVATISFADLLDRFNVEAIDVLQIDAEGMDAKLLSWFPFDRLKPAVVHYEIAHMPAAVLDATRTRLNHHGYRLYSMESPTDQVAIRL